jgi:hypothetical protein
MVFDEQILEVLKYSNTALNPQVTKELIRLLNSYSQEDWYKEEAMKNGIILPSKI